MKLAFFSFLFFFSTASFSDERVLLADDIGTPEAKLSFRKFPKNQVEIMVEYNSGNGFCGGESFDYCSDFKLISLPELSRIKRDVFFQTAKSKVYCGKISGFFSTEQHSDYCKLEVIPKTVCTRWFSEFDCVEAQTIYSAYLVIKE